MAVPSNGAPVTPPLHGRIPEPVRTVDLIAAEGNPLENVRLLANPHRNLKFILKGGHVVKNETLQGNKRVRGRWFGVIQVSE